MIGNDIVDLRTAKQESNWQRKGYLQKVFTPAEQKLILESASPDILVWLFWSMKEAAYKIYSKEMDIRNYAPTSLECSIYDLDGQTSSGQVSIGGITYYTRSSLHHNFIHTICADSLVMLQQIKVSIQGATHPADLFTPPVCHSHHGAYLAQVYLTPGSLRSIG
ncbi:phosphopantetheinyl transferase (holo-ACP synthase) [Pedobacter sp. CAN_A7]|uniref:4'-phosphopantetheinyl transferase family protein n=1 Tax=Pedobacter sp. CAN_A7 TaxID=2787722 RepID=UPI0018CADFFF